jgi:hypothetical protein
MSQYPSTRRAGYASDSSGWWAGAGLFAALIMILVSIWQAMVGLIALVQNDFYVATRDYPFKFDATTWGWIHMLGGVLVALAGWALLSGQTWARVVGIVLAVLSAIAVPAASCTNGLRRTTWGAATPVRPLAVCSKRTEPSPNCGCGHRSGRAAPAKVMAADASRRVVLPIWPCPRCPWGVMRPSSTSMKACSSLGKRASFLARGSSGLSSWSGGLARRSEVTTLQVL